MRWTVRGCGVSYTSLNQDAGGSRQLCCSAAYSLCSCSSSSFWHCTYSSQAEELLVGSSAREVCEQACSV